MRIQLWTRHYAPEPTGNAPLAEIWAKEMVRRGHEVEVVAAHPHYPQPDWGKRTMPYREVRDGIPVTRLPLFIGRRLKSERFIQEMSFTAGQAAAAPFLGTPDVLVSITPSFTALLPGLVNSKLRRIPWILWVQDILPDGAATTGYVDRSGFLYRSSRKLESAAYDAATKIVVLSESFRNNLVEKDVPRDKIEVAYNPATMNASPGSVGARQTSRPAPHPVHGKHREISRARSIVRAFESNERIANFARNSS